MGLDSCIHYCSLFYIEGILVTTDKTLAFYRQQLRKSLTHLEYSFNQVQARPQRIESMTEEDLAIWESLTARFSRVVDIFLGKYLRLLILERDPGFQGFVRDYLDASEKAGFIQAVDPWLNFRGVRNRIAHEYLDSQLEGLFKFVFASCPLLIQEVKKHATQ